MTWLLRKSLAIQKSLVNLFAICWTCQQKCDYFGGSNIHVLPSLPYSAQDFYTSIDVLAELDNGTQVIIEIQVHHQNFFINRLWAYLCSQVNQNLEKFANEKVIHTRVINTSHLYMLSQLWTATTSQMTWLFIALVCERTRQVKS